jgi:hypothetical protein
MGEGGHKDPFDAALGEAILGYLDALPPEDLVRAFLAMRGLNGVQEEAFLEAWAGSAVEREGLLSAAKKLQDAGELRRLRVYPLGLAGGEGGEPARFVWLRGRAVGNRSIGNRTAHPREVPRGMARRRPEGTNDDGPSRGGADRM